MNAHHLLFWGVGLFFLVVFFGWRSTRPSRKWKRRQEEEDRYLLSRAAEKWAPKEY